MDVIQQLPFPDEICHKIVLYAFKSPHIHLREVIFKRALSKPIYQKLAEEGEIEIDAQGYVTRATCLWNHVDLESIQFDIRVLPRNLTEINFASTGVTGDIQILRGLRHLTTFFLDGTGVTGHIQVLQGLQHLTTFSLARTGVFGDIQLLQGLSHLTRFDLRNTSVMGAVQVLQELPRLIEFYLDETGVTGDKYAYYDYRKLHRLRDCYVSL